METDVKYLCVQVSLHNDSGIHGDLKEVIDTEESDQDEAVIMEPVSQVRMLYIAMILLYDVAITLYWWNEIMNEYMNVRCNVTMEISIHNSFQYSKN